MTIQAMKTKKAGVSPELENIEEGPVKQFARDLIDILNERDRNIYDDLIYLFTKMVGVKVGTITRDMDAASGDISYTGFGHKPGFLILLGVHDITGSAYIGVSDGSNDGCVGVYGATPNYGKDSSNIMVLYEAAGKTQTATVKSFDSDGVTLTWTRVGATAAATKTMIYLSVQKGE